MKTRSFFIAVGLGLLWFFINPLGLNLDQQIILSASITCICLWANGGLKNSHTSIILILVYSLVGQTRPIDIVSFVYSNTALLIMTTSVLCIGLTNSGLVDKFIDEIMKRTGYSLRTLLILPYVLGFVLIFLIPQAFARSLILAGVFANIISSDEKYKNLKSVILFNVFLAISITYMFFSTGDIVINGSAMAFAENVSNQSISFGQWAGAMGLPTLITAVVGLGIVNIIFKTELGEFDDSAIMVKESREFDSQMKISLAIILCIIVAWITRPYHGIDEWIPAAIGLVFMLMFKIIELEDFKSVNPGFILFLTAAFSIGKVMGENGITDVVFEYLKNLIPAGDSSLFLMALSVVIMALHMIIGSSVASLSVALPLFIPLAESMGYSSNLIMLMSYVMVNIHFLLPHQHANMMVGIGQEYYSDKMMLKFGIVMTPVTLILMGVVFLPWFRFVGI